MKAPLYKALAHAIRAIGTCNQEWSDRYRDHLSYLEFQLPHGSGFDCGCKIDLDKSTPDRIYINFSYHHMTEHGYYNGWTDHTIKITPSLVYDFEIKINRNRVDSHLLDYFYETIRYDLSCEVDLYPKRNDQ